MSKESQLVAIKPPSGSSADQLRYIADMATELQWLAAGCGSQLLAHLLAIAAAEAQERAAEASLQKRSETRPST